MVHNAGIKNKRQQGIHDIYTIFICFARRINTLTVFPSNVSVIGSPSFFCCMKVCSSFCKNIFFFFGEKLNSFWCKCLECKNSSSNWLSKLLLFNFLIRKEGEFYFQNWRYRTCLRRRPNIRYIAISAHEAEFPVASLGILATLIPCFVAASISTPWRKPRNLSI